MRKIYRWEVWLKPPRTEIVRGVDYFVSQSTMVQAIRNEASQRGIRVSVLDLEDRIVIWVRAHLSVSIQESAADSQQLQTAE